jgi:hypothetical protein
MRKAGEKSAENPGPQDIVTKIATPGESKIRAATLLLGSYWEKYWGKTSAALSLHHSARKGPGNTNGLQKGPRPRKMVAKVGEVTQLYVNFGERPF